MGLFDFLANAPPEDPRSAQALAMRQKIALAMIGRDRKGYPKTLGEGLTAIGDAIGERGQLNAAQQQLAAYEGYARAHPPPDVNTLLPPAAAAPPAATRPGPQASLPPPAEADGAAGPVAEQPVAAAAPPEEGGYNFIDAQAGGRFKPTPGYLQDAIAAREPNPDMQAYYGSLSGTEAPKGARDISPTGAAGPYQFTQGTGARYGVSGAARMDPGASTDAVRAFTADNAAAFQRANGRPPTYQELAIMHQQGPGGGMALLSGRSAPARNLAVNNMAGYSPSAAVAKMNRFYGMPNEVASVGGAPPDTAVADAAGATRLSDVVGLEKGDTGAYAQTASRGDIQSDAPDVGLTGTSAKTGAAAADTMMQARDQLAKRLILQQMQPTAPGVPPPNPTQPGAASLPPTSMPISAAGAGTQVDIAPAPVAPIPVAGAQMAQATPPSRQQPTPPMNEPKLPDNAPRNRAEIEGDRLQQEGLQLSDPMKVEQGKFLSAKGKEYRDKQDADAREAYRLQYQTWQARSNPQALEELAKAQRENKLSQQLGGLDQAVVFQPIQKSADETKTIPMAQTAIRNARQAATEGKMFTGTTGEVDLSLKKLMSSAGFPTDPRINATEEFKSFVKPILAAARQALVGGANISDSDMKIAEAAVGGSITLDRNSIVGILGSLERMNTAMAANHQRKVEAVAGDDPQRQSILFGTYGLPMENVVPREAIGLLRSQPTPQVMDQFNKKYHTPGLAQRILGGGG